MPLYGGRALGHVPRRVARVDFTSHLKTLFPKIAGGPHHSSAATVADLIAELDALEPGFAFYVCDELGRLRQHVNVFVDGERVSDRATLSDPVEPGARVLILQALSGG